MKVPHDDYVRAITNWVQITESDCSWMSFLNFLGLDRAPAVTEHVWHMTDEAADKVHMLLSPHYKTLYKIDQIRKASEET